MECPTQQFRFESLAHRFNCGRSKRCPCIRAFILFCFGAAIILFGERARAFTNTELSGPNKFGIIANSVELSRHECQPSQFILCASFRSVSCFLIVQGSPKGSGCESANLTATMMVLPKKKTNKCPSQWNYTHNLMPCICKRSELKQVCWTKSVDKMLIYAKFKY